MIPASFPSGVLPPLEVVTRTDPGLDPAKQVNEDAFVHVPTTVGHLLVVCDGMGGHQAGADASRIAIETIVELVGVAPAGSHPRIVLAAAIAEAGRRVYAFGGAPGGSGRPGSTCVAALVHPAGVEVAHVGDSRLYVVRAGQIWPLTRDHSVVQHMIDAGMLTPDAAYGHPDSNKITRALGLAAETEVESRPEPVAFEPGDIFVLATDGLCDLARPDEIRDVVLGARTLDAAAESLVALANARGGHDNITVVLARPHVASIAVAPPAPGPVAPTHVEAPAPAGATIVDATPALPGATWHDATVDEPASSPTPTAPPPPSSGTLVLGVGLIVVGAILLGVALFHFFALDHAHRAEAPAPSTSASR